MRALGGCCCLQHRLGQGKRGRLHTPSQQEAPYWVTEMKTLHAQLEYAHELRSEILGREMNVGITGIRSLHIENQKSMSPQLTLLSIFPLVNISCSSNDTCVHAQLQQLCPTVCNPIDCSLPGSSVHGILQARILQWVAMAYSRGFS